MSIAVNLWSRNQWEEKRQKKETTVARELIQRGITLKNNFSILFTCSCFYWAQAVYFMTYGHTLSARRCMRNQEVANNLEPRPGLPRSLCLQPPLTKARFCPHGQPSLACKSQHFRARIPFCPCWLWRSCTLRLRRSKLSLFTQVLKREDRSSQGQH